MLNYFKEEITRGSEEISNNVFEIVNAMNDIEKSSQVQTELVQIIRKKQRQFDYVEYSIEFS